MEEAAVRLASVEKLSGMASQADSSDSEGETEPAKAFHRRISTNREIKTSVSWLVLKVFYRTLSWLYTAGPRVTHVRTHSACVARHAVF